MEWILVVQVCYNIISKFKWNLNIITDIIIYLMLLCYNIYLQESDNNPLQVLLLEVPKQILKRRNH